MAETVAVEEVVVLLLMDGIPVRVIGPAEAVAKIERATKSLPKERPKSQFQHHHLFPTVYEDEVE